MGTTYEKIGLLDHTGFGNMGDAATLAAFIENIRKRLPNTILVGFSSNPNDTRERHDIPSYPIRWSYPGWDLPDGAPAGAAVRKSKLKSAMKRFPRFYASMAAVLHLAREAAHLLRSYRVLKSLDLLIIAGGGQLCDLWRGPWALPYGVFKFCLLARLSGTKLLILNVGAGPLKHPASKFLAKWSVRLADYISFRDAESQVLLQSAGCTAITHVYADTAYSLCLGNYLAKGPSVTAMPTVGLNIMGYCDPRLWPRKDSAVYCRYLDKIAAFSSRLLAANYRIEVFTSDILVDRHAIADLEKKLSGRIAPERIANIAYRPVTGLEELLAQMAGFDFVITSKFHGVIFSHLLARPVIALSYDPKINHLMRKAGHSRYCLDIEHFDLSSLETAFTSLTKDAHDIRAQLRRVVATHSDMLRRQFDSIFGGQATA